MTLQEAGSILIDKLRQDYTCDINVGIGNDELFVYTEKKIKKPDYLKNDIYEGFKVTIKVIGKIRLAAT